MANVFDVSRYILENVGGEISTMKLQKLCYYSQAWNLVWQDAPLFDNEIQAWRDGPVCKDLYEIHQGLFSISANQINDSQLDRNLTEHDVTTINKVIDFYGKKDGGWLSELTHKELPWKQTRKEAGANPGDHCDASISNDLMNQYYSGI